MSLKTRHKEDILIFDFDGDDLHDFRDDLRLIIEEAAKKTNKIIINLKGLENINSHLIGVISSSKRMMSSLDGDLVVITATEKILNVLKVVHMDKIIKITANEKDAIDYLKKI